MLCESQGQLSSDTARASRDEHIRAGYLLARQKRVEPAQHRGACDNNKKLHPERVELHAGETHKRNKEIEILGTQKPTQDRRGTERQMSAKQSKPKPTSDTQPAGSADTAKQLFWFNVS